MREIKPAFVCLRPCGFIRNYISSSLSNNNNVELESIKNKPASQQRSILFNYILIRPRLVARTLQKNVAGHAEDRGKGKILDNYSHCS